jgi:hypothetical protein
MEAYNEEDEEEPMDVRWYGRLWYIHCIRYMSLLALGVERLSRFHYKSLRCVSILHRKQSST